MRVRALFFGGLALNVLASVLFVVAWPPSYAYAWCRSRAQRLMAAAVLERLVLEERRHAR